MNTNVIKTQVVVLGSGPSGYSAAFRCADLGLKTVLIEQFSALGGVCLNVGCIPSKSLLHIAQILNETKMLKNAGILFNKPKIDLFQMRQWKSEIILKLTNGLKSMANARKVEIIHGYGNFVDSHILSIKNHEKTITLNFDQAIIAVGSKPIQQTLIKEPNEKIWDSTDALKISFIPKRLLIVGGGIIGLEMATIYHALGSEIYISEISEQIISAADSDVIESFYKNIKHKFNIMLNTKINNLRTSNNHVQVELNNTKNNKITNMSFHAVLFSIGRSPNSKLINVQDIGVEVDKSGYIKVDNQMRTNIPHIYAIGDVIGQPMLAHKGMYQGHIAAEVIYGEKHYFDPKVIPSIAYTYPEVSWVGITEKEAKINKLSYESSTFPWSALGRAVSSGYNGMTKLIFHKDTKRIIGGAVVGCNSSEILGEISLAIEMGCDVNDIALTIHAHPTLHESIGRASEMFSGTITDFLNKKTKNIV
ncbi:lipoamide dehydrogenase [Wigglesworthia glossinidia endosymbiont of Glossina morsitans morsitans (Yale colony)]|uniref:Dihydrolipoyl dehydrogenase n=1 Tax=Wigglesworthia glossinidia endosymbiont of Glossina morsitans morsitans (Yale colony) TaxID=1142511 RepID=H6Q4Z6_WIGGL|nr:dihydrolipoyl dehydrogenase [Wigglesworthia glossinidia]AFA41279.1 lipoamide dehydrogenase [Wigglesworthia glossinidia endosymbiont of Glossina morsitans morsitans (Yale colony)]